MTVLVLLATAAGARVVASHNRPVCVLLHLSSSPAPLGEGNRLLVLVFLPLLVPILLIPIFLVLPVFIIGGPDGDRDNLAYLINQIAPARPIYEEDWEDEGDWDEEDWDEEWEEDEYEEPISFPPWRRRGGEVRKSTDVPVVGRNDPCPCGSGKKYKYCHGKKK